MIELNLKGKNAIVTGSGQGIGRAIALRLAEAGANVAIADVNVTLAEEVAAEAATYGVKSKAYKVNVVSPGEMDALSDDVVDMWGSLDIMVNNAGIGHCLLFEDSNLACIMAVMRQSGICSGRRAARS